MSAASDRVARALVAPGGPRAARRARRGGHGARRRDVPGDPDEPGLPAARRRCSRSGGVAELRGIEVVDGELRLGAMATHREVERDARVREGWPVLARAFGLVASPRVRNQATVGGVLADADYASDPPAVLQALGARAVLRSPRGERAVPIEELILGLLRDLHRARRAARRGPRPARRPSGPCTASSARARARTGRASPSRRRARGRAARRGRRGRRRRRSTSPTCARSPTGARSTATLAAEIGRALRRAHRADRRRARLGRLPPPGHGGRGAPRDRGARRVTRRSALDARASPARQRYLGRRRAPGHAPRGVRALAARARARARASTPRRCRTDCVALDARRRRRPRAVRLPGARPARAGRRGPLRRRRRRRRRRADARGGRAPRRGSCEVELRGAAGRLRRRRGRRAGRGAAASATPRRPRDEAVSIGVRPLPGTNVCHRFRLVSGDAAAGLRRRPTSSSRRRSARRAPRTSPMEPHAALAEWEDGRLTVWAGTQTPFNVRADLAGLFGLAEEDVRIVAPPMGGSFGAKTFVRTEALVAALARKARRPVKVVLDRTEEFVTLNRHPATIRVRIGARARRHAGGQGARLLGRHGRLRRLRPGRRDQARLRRRRARTGSRTCASTRSPIYTNLPPNGAYRGYGAMQSVWASERTMDVLAERLDMSPLELRRKNLLRDGRPLRHRRGDARRALRGVPAGRGRRRRLRGRPARQGPVRAAQGHADAEPRGDQRRAHAGRLRRALGVVRDGPGRAPLDPAHGRRAARLRAGPGRAPRPRHGHLAVRHPHDVEPLDPHDGPRARRRGRRPARRRRRARLRRGPRRGRPRPRHRAGDRLLALAPGRRRRAASRVDEETGQVPSSTCTASPTPAASSTARAPSCRTRAR